uniref:F-box/LRR-repeat protein n=1 Tax=Strongyloides venezuelensis TaxID=75913 RepID=A0A0K0FLL4_STRVS
MNIFLQTLGDFVSIDNTDITIDIHFNVPKCDVNIWASSNSPAKEDSTLNYNLQDYRRHMMCLEKEEMKFILRGLSKMQNLKTLKLDFDVMPERFKHSKLFRVLNKNLKNTKFVNYCLTEPRYFDLISLSENCPDIENISLHGVARHDTTING